MSDDAKLQKTDPANDLPPDLQAEADAMLAEVGADQDTPPGADQGETSKPDTAEMMSTMLNITFNGLVAPRRGAHWKMSDSECHSLGVAYGAVIDKYFPDFDMGCEFVALITTFTVFGPRIAADTKAEADRVAKKGGDTPAASAQDSDE